MSNGQYIKTSERLPENQSLKNPKNKYYRVFSSGYGEFKAMFADGEWYFNYISKIIVPVTQWYEEGIE
ncbi:MAG: DUF551 domain-containing protein [Alphaproteobacteria bacterium]|nr:DUF551 domain-containing protein [Alphaproteobacteria bacterium]